MSYAQTALDSEHWKNKYRKLVAEWENSEETWRHAERSLRKCVARLALMGQGLNGEFDQQLARLRDAVHNEENLRALGEVLEETVRSADQHLEPSGQNEDAEGSPPDDAAVSAELQEFLLSVTERLREIDSCLKDSEIQGDASMNATEEMNQCVRQELAGIQSSVGSSSDMVKLRQVVQSRLGNIQDALVSHLDNQKQHRDRSKNEIGRLLTRLEELETESNELRTQVVQERLRASLDSLTGLYNRAAFDDRLEQEIARCERYRSPLSVIMWDVDHFKKINDNYGHQVGDKVLKVIADLLTKMTRQTDFSARYGGEEFVSLLPETKLDQAQVVAEKIRKAIEQCKFSYQKSAVRVTISAGLTSFVDDDDPEAFMVRADKALYDAKHNGRNRVHTSE